MLTALPFWRLDTYHTRWQNQARVGDGLNDVDARLIHANALLSIHADIELQAPADAITAVAFHPTDPEKLLCSAWDGVSL